MAFKWLDASEAEKFGQALAQFFVSKVAPGTAKDKEQLAKQFEAVDKMYVQIDHFKKDHKLNIYKKAKFGSAFKDELLTAGYKAEFVDQITRDILLKL